MNGPAFERIRDLLQREGRLTFAAFMAEALYGSDGYYTRRPRLGGASADFFTSPELHPAFGALFGRLAARIWDALCRPASFDVEEHGPGTGALCRDLLTWANNAAPDFARAIQYRLVETSDALRAVQRETLSLAGLPDARVTWETPPPPTPPPCARVGPQLPLPRARGMMSAKPIFAPRSGQGGGSILVLANELVDALPVHLVTMRDGTLYERYVVADGDGLGWRDDNPSTDALLVYFERLGVWPGDGCVAEVNLAGVEWMERTAGTVDRGALLVLDYGYPAPEMYAPTRRYGTLLTYREHTLGSDPLRDVGAQDITTHVDFTSLARAGERGGLETVGLISQAVLLRRLGIDGYLRQLDRSSLPAGDHDANRRAMLALVEPDGLGRVQGLLQTRGLPDFDPFAGLSEDAYLPLLSPDQMRLPGPLEAEGFLDLEGQWQELVAEIGEGEADEPEARP